MVGIVIWLFKVELLSVEHELCEVEMTMLKLNFNDIVEVELLSVVWWSWNDEQLDVKISWNVKVEV